MTKELRSAMREASKSLSAAIEDMADKVNAVLASRDMKMAARSVLAGKLRKAASRKDLNWQTLLDALCVKSRSEAVAALAAMIDPKGILTERERHILDIWPRFEDGELVMPGDKVHYFSAYNDETEIEVESITAMDGYFVLCDDECRSNQYEQGQRVKRPVQSVLDADGVEIKVGDSMYVANDGDGPYIVCDIDENIDRIELFWHENRNEKLFIAANRLTHTRPDSWERLEEDAELNDETGIVGGNLDLIRRAKALAEAEVGR